MNMLCLLVCTWTYISEGYQHVPELGDHHNKSEMTWSKEKQLKTKQQKYQTINAAEG